MVLDLVIWRGKQVLVGDQLIPATVLVRGRRIERVSPGFEVLDGVIVEEVPDNNILMAGLVDSHVHINEPGRTDWEGFTTATKAAAMGGVTTLVDMPLNSIPPTTTVENLRVKVDAAKPQCWVDVGFWGGVIPDNSPHLKDMVALGVPGFKCFLIYSGVPEFPAVNRQQVREALLEIKNTGATLLFHAECEEEKEGDCDKDMDPGQYSTFLSSRPPSMEVSAIQLIIELCRETRVPCHIVHLSTAAALPMIKMAKEEGLPLTVETCHHYLSLVAEDIPIKATQYKCCPPIRESANREELWKAVKEGVIDMMVSDHSPCTPDLKQPGYSDFMEAWGGISSVQFGLSLAWSQAEERGLNIADIHRLMSKSPAKLAKLQDRKGKLAAGYDADLVVWDPMEKEKVDVRNIQHRNKLTPYLGMELKGVVHRTVVGGKEVYNRKKGFLGGPNGRLLLAEGARL